MKESNLPAYGQKSFEELKQSNQYGAEYWNARGLQPLLGYNQWRSFENAIKKAITSCEQSGNRPDHHFARARKPIVGGKGAVQDVVDYHLSRFACYLIAQNGDPRKPEIADALCHSCAGRNPGEIRATSHKRRVTGHGPRPTFFP